MFGLQVACKTLAEFVSTKKKKFLWAVKAPLEERETEDLNVPASLIPGRGTFFSGMCCLANVAK